MFKTKKEALEEVKRKKLKKYRLKKETYWILARKGQKW